jgi:hypothetical protein
VAALNVIHVGNVRDREIDGLSWEDKKKILEELAREAYIRVHCNGAPGASKKREEYTEENGGDTKPA